MPSAEEIANQQVLLSTHRQTLAVYLKRLAILGVAHSPPEIFHGIREARENIRRVKDILQGWDLIVEDHPDDEDHSSEPEILLPVTLSPTAISAYRASNLLTAEQIKILHILHEARATDPLSALPRQTLVEKSGMSLDKIRKVAVYLEENGYIVIRDRHLGTRILYSIYITAKGVIALEEDRSKGLT